MSIFEKQRFVAYFLCLTFISFSLCLSAVVVAQDETSDAKIIERYKQMLNRKPREGSAFERLYQFYLEGAGLDAMVADYQAAAAAKPNAPNVQLILGHIYKRLGQDASAVAAYQRAVELAPTDYYPYFALGQVYAILHQHENAIRVLKQAAALSEQTQDVPIEELTAIYKALGHAYFRRDRVDEAIQAWHKISELDRQDIFARIELAALFREQELYEQAIAQHEAIIRHKADDPYRVCLSRREIGNIYEAKGDYQDAIQSYDTALALTAPGNWLRKDLQHRIIGIFAADSDWQGLIEYYQRKLETTPNAPELMGLLAAAYVENQQLEEGIAVYRKGLELAPTDANLRLNLIAALRNAEKFADAAAEYEVLCEQTPDDFGIYRELGELYLQLEDEVEARATYQRMIARDPENASTHLLLAEIYTGNEWIADAIAAYEKALSLSPDNLDYIAYFGEFYFRQGSREKAIETWNRMVEDDKGIAENYARLAKLLNAKNFHTEAIAARRKAVELMPDVYRYREALAKQLMKNGNFDAALAEFTEAAKLAPNAFFAEEMDNQRIELYRRQGTLRSKIETVEAELEKSDLTAADILTQQKRLAKMYLKLGNITYALEIILKAKALQPDDAIINRWLAAVYTKQNRRDEANAIYKHLIQVDSANAREYYTSIARSHLNVMDFTKATATAKQVIAHSPRNPEGYQLLAEIGKQSGNYESAVDNLKQALRLQPEAIEIRKELAATYKLAGKPRQAIAQYWRCWELRDTVNDKLVFVKPLSEAYYDLGRRAEFEDKLKQLAKSNTAGVAPILALAELYRTEGDLQNARFQLAQALDRERKNPDLLEQLVNISLDLGDNPDALTYQQRLVKVHPDPSHQRRLGELLFDAGREQEAIQAWTKLLHAKNQMFDAEIKLTGLLIQHGHLDEALFVIDRATDKISGADAHIAHYKVGMLLVSMREFDRARTHFQRILSMPKPEGSSGHIAATQTNVTSGPPGINPNKFELARSLIWEIQDGSYRAQNARGWLPKSFEEARAGALVHLVTIAQQQGKLNAFIQQYETYLETNPKDIKTLEILAHIYTLTENTQKTNNMIERLIAVSPNDSTYQAIRLNEAIQRNLPAETLEKYLNNIPGLTEETHLWYTFQYIKKRYREGQKAAAENLMSEFEDIKVTDLNTVDALIETLVLMKKTDAAVRIIDKLPIPTQPQQAKYRSLYNRVTTAYLNLEQYDRAIALFWTYCEKTQPQITNTRRMAFLPTSSFSSSGTSLQTIFPTTTVYYEGSRFRYLQYFSRQLWLKNRHEALYTKLRTTFDAAAGRNRIFSGLALSYSYWWNGAREKSQEVLVSLQREFPQDLSLKLSTVFIAIQTGQHAGTLQLLEELAVADPRNRRQYYDLTLKLALQTGNTVAVRDLIGKLLNSPISARELYTFSKQLQNAGYTQHATAIMNKAMHLAMGIRDADFLMDLSRLLEELGRGQDAARMAERALRFANQRDRYGRTLSTWKRQRATHLTSQSKSNEERETLLIAAAEKNPNSHSAFMNLATFYEGKDKIDEASAAFKTALSLRPKDSKTRKRYAEMLHRAGKYEEAVPQYIKLLKDNPNSLGYDTWDAIETFFKAEKIDELISLSKEMVTPSVGRDFNNELARDVASELIDTNDHKAAIGIYEKLIEAQPNDTYYYRSLAGAYAAIGEHEKAIRILRDILETGEDAYSQEATLEMLTRFYKLYGELDEFIKEYDTKLAENPTDTNLRYLVAKMKIAANDLKGADEHTDQLLDADSFNTGQLHNLAEAYRLAGVREREFQILEKIVQKYEGSWAIYHRLGTIYALTGEIEKAQDAYRKMGRLRFRYGGNDFVEYMNVASIYMHNQMWDEAEPLFTKIVNDLSVGFHYRRDAEEQLVAIKKRRANISSTGQLKDKIKNMDIGTLRTLAKDFARRGDSQEALLIYTHLEKVMPEDFESRAQLATLYTTQNQYDNAVATWDALLAEDPGNTKFQDGLVRTYQKAGKIEKALEIAQEYINRDDDNAIHYVRKAKLYADDDRIDEAIAGYQKSIELAPGNVERYRELAALHLRKKDKDSAKKAFQAALRFTGQEYEREDIQQEILKLSEGQENLEETIQKAKDEGALTFGMQKERAETLRDDAKLTEASTAYEKALDMTSDSYQRRRIYEQLLDIYPKIGNDDAAIKMHDELAFIPYIANSARLARNRLINAYDSANKLETLKSVFNARLENEPNNINDMEILAEIYKWANDHGKVAEMYQAISKLQPDNVLSYYNAAAAYNSAGQSELAEEMLNRGEGALSVSNRKGSRSFLEELGDVCYNGKLYDSAVKFADAAIAESVYTRIYGIGSPAESAYKLLAKSLYAAKRYEEAVYAYQQVVNMTGSNEARRAIENASRLGNLYENQVPKLLKKVEENPNDPEARLALAETYEKVNKIDEAIAQYQKLGELQPDNAQWQQKLGDLYQKQTEERHATGEVIENIALHLDGDSSFVEVDSTDILNNITQQVTVSVWIKPTAFPNRYTPIIFKGDERTPNISNRSYILYLREDGKVQIASSPNGRGETSFYTEADTVRLNQWYHIAGVIDAKRDTMKIFINGIEVGNKHFSGQQGFYQSQLPLRIGWTHEEERPTQSPFVGFIDEVRIWNIARTEAEIRADMNTELKGDEPGLVAYYKFDGETEGVVLDASPNKNSSRLIGNAELLSYTRPIFETRKITQLAQAAAAYQKAIEIAPTSYELYRSLAEIYTKDGRSAEAEAVYRRALDTPLAQRERDEAIYAIWTFYANTEQEKKGIAVLEELKQQIENSARLYELLGDAYKEAGDAEKAEIANTQWIQLRRREINQRQDARTYREFAAQLLRKGVYPEVALEYAERAIQSSTSSSYVLTLAHAYLANDQHENALAQYERGLNTDMFSFVERDIFVRLAKVGRNTKDKHAYIDMLNKLIEAMSDKATAQLNAQLVLAEFYQLNDMHEEAAAYIQKTGFITENEWLHLGPFDNTDGIGYNTAYISENLTQIDMTAKYAVGNGHVSWQKVNDDVLNGYIQLGQNLDWRVAYAFTTITSPDERQVEFRFDSDDQGKLYLNGEEVFTHTQTYAAAMDKYIIPVTLKKGKNSILVKVCDQTGGWGFYLRITDRDGNPFEDLKFDSTEQN